MRRLKILIVSPKVPYPLNDGAKNVIYNTAKYLSRRNHEVVMFCINNCPGNSHQKILDDFEVVTSHLNTKNRIGAALINFTDPMPYNISKYHSWHVLEELNNLIIRSKFDLVQIEQLHMAWYGVYIRKEYGLPVILREHNIESGLMKRFYQNQKNPIVKSYACLQYKKLYKYEAFISSQFNGCITISEADSDRLKVMNRDINPIPISAGVDFSQYYPIALREEPHSIVHVGSMNWLPNIEAMLWFCKKVFPRILKKCPGARFYMVGANPPSIIRRLASRHVIVTGFVEDPREYIAKSSVYVVPLLTGGGIRIKILEALAMKKAIVSTSVGCEGIGLVHNKNIIIADFAEDFATSVVRLIYSDDEKHRLAEAALSYARSKFEWDKIAGQFESVYEQVLNEGSRC